MLADGTGVAAGPDGDRELWWALRGGGNLGRLLAAKHRYDPANLIASAVPALIGERAFL